MTTTQIIEYKEWKLDIWILFPSKNTFKLVTKKEKNKLPEHTHNESIVVTVAT